METPDGCHVFRNAAKLFLIAAILSVTPGCITQDGIMLGVPCNSDSSENGVEIRSHKCYGISIFWL